MSMFTPTVILGIVTNIICVVGIVITNKYLSEVDGYRFMIFLSFLHFFFTTVGMRVLLAFNMYTYKPAPIGNVLPVAIGSLLSVAFMNLNLQFNSVGFYQLSKLACIPFVLIVQYIYFNQSVSYLIKLTLIPITFGVGFATVYDLDVNFMGTVFASCAVAATGLAQIFTNTYQKSLGCDAMQLLYHTSPLIFFGMLIMCPMFDDVNALMNFEYSFPCVMRILLSCCFALGVNISNYLVLGKTSPLTYQVLGHLKTIFILILGFVLFQKVVDYRNIIGIVIAMVGVIAYTEIKRQETSVLPK
jgi:solute carrier family 35, member E3